MDHTKKHSCKFDQRVKRKVSLESYGATVHDPSPSGVPVGVDWLLLWKCSCGKTQAYDLIREAQ